MQDTACSSSARILLRDFSCVSLLHFAPIGFTFQLAGNIGIAAGRHCGLSSLQEIHGSREVS